MKKPFIKVRVPKRKRIALVAHDGMKTEMFAWMAKHIETLKNHDLCGTGTTSTIIRNQYHLDIKSFTSGPLGGDQQIGAAISTGDIDILIFFWDPMEAQPHDPDVKALLRIAVLYDVPVCMSPTSATIIMESDFLNKETIKYVPNTEANIMERVDDLDFEEELH